MNKLGMQSRRVFVAETMRLGSLVISVDVLVQFLAGCESPTSSGSSSASPLSGMSLIEVTENNGTVTLTIDAGSPLNAVGTAAFLKTSSRTILVAHTTETTFKAVTAVCTHEGCSITRFSGGIYTCPCHGSQFSTTGAVVRGPASTALSSFAASFANGQLTITL